MLLKIKRNKKRSNNNVQVTRDGYLVSDWFCQPLQVVKELNQQTQYKRGW